MFDRVITNKPIIIFLASIEVFHKVIGTHPLYSGI